MSLFLLRRCFPNVTVLCSLTAYRATGEAREAPVPASERLEASTRRGLHIVGKP